MPDKEGRPWLPDSYQPFAQAADNLSQYYGYRRIFVGGFTGIFMAGAVMEKPEIIAVGILGATFAYLLFSPKSWVNIPGKRSYAEAYQQARAIAQQEGWYQDQLGPDGLIRQVQTTATLTRELTRLAPLPQTPEKRIREFDSLARVVQKNNGSTQQGITATRNIARRALNFAEGYWSSQGPDGQMMVVAITRRRTALFTQGHMGFQSGKIL